MLGLLLPNGAEVNDYFKDADVFPNNFWTFFWASLFAVVASYYTMYYLACWWINNSCGGNKISAPARACVRRIITTDTSDDHWKEK